MGIASTFIDPLTLTHFLLVYVVVALIPGYALITLVRPHSPRYERLALTVPCAYTLTVVCGLTTALLHLPFTLFSYAALAVPVVICASRVAWLRRRDTPFRIQKGLWLVPAGVAALHVAVTLWVSRGTPIPIGYDAPIHLAYVEAILRAHIFLITLISSRIGANDGPFYPAAFHGLAALLADAAGLPAYRATYLSIVAATATAPFLLFAYVRVALGTERVAALAALAALAFEPLPQFALAQGLYPLLVAILFLPALALALRRGLWEGERRSVLLAALLGVGLLYTHPTEATAIVLPLLVLAPTLTATTKVWARAMGYGAILAVIWGAVMLPALTAVHRATAWVPDGSPSPADLGGTVAHFSLAGEINGYVSWIYGRNISYLLLVAVVVGGIRCLVRRQHRGLVVAQALIALFFIDGNDSSLARYLHLLSFHWTLIERLAPLHYWVTLPLAALGIDTIGQIVGRLYARRPLHARALVTGLVATPCIVFGLAVPFAVSAARVSNYVAWRVDVAPADLGSLSWLARHAPPTATVLNDADMAHPNLVDGAIDAALWLPALGGPQPVFARSAEGIGALPDRFNALAHIADPTMPPRARRFVQQAHIHYVFYGARVTRGTTRHLVLARLLAAPGLRLAYTSATSCRDTPQGARGCPTTASYVFALRLQP
jgi:hypothetical protein